METIKNNETAMQKSIEALKRNFSGIRTGRANPALLDNLHVDYYGSSVPLKQVASIAVPEPRLLQITAYDKSAVVGIEKAIQASDLGLTPKTEGGVIRLVLPELSEQRRKDLTKIIKKEAEEAKVVIRNIRRDGLEELKTRKAEKGITEDEQKLLDKKIQELTDKYCAEADHLAAVKEKEILSI
ncbi:MAG: ribosome recycling factor [Candidatus Margulisbacteria bacterium]|nr:ribosome recycling factor [Candidatus Margulisiibacteriota bacterium]MBU1616416.1 ribosome recycling factor [Candidatus Margulisiibacteriota bacterium]